MLGGEGEVILARLGGKRARQASQDSRARPGWFLAIAVHLARSVQRMHSGTTDLQAYLSAPSGF